MSHVPCNSGDFLYRRGRRTFTCVYPRSVLLPVSSSGCSRTCSVSSKVCKRTRFWRERGLGQLGSCFTLSRYPPCMFSGDSNHARVSSIRRMPATIKGQKTNRLSTCVQRLEREVNSITGLLSVGNDNTGRGAGGKRQWERGSSTLSLAQTRGYLSHKAEM